MIRHLRRTTVFFLAAIIMSFPAFCPAADGDQIEKIEKAIIHASDLFEQGMIKKGDPYTVTISPSVQLSFHEGTFDEDLEAAFTVLDRLMAAGLEKEELHEEPAAQPKPPDDRISALRDSERSTSSGASPSDSDIPVDYSVFKNYQQLHSERLLQENAAAEADMQTVIAEREAASQELIQRKQRKQDIQAQAMGWQQELDNQAAESARAAAEWQRQHSFGTYAKKFLGVMLESSLGAFGGAYFGTLGNLLANKAIDKTFTKKARKNVPKAGREEISSALEEAKRKINQSGKEPDETVILQPKY